MSDTKWECEDIWELRDKCDALETERTALRTAIEASTELIKTLWDAADDYYTSLHPSIEIWTNQQIAANEAVTKGEKDE